MKQGPTLALDPSPELCNLICHDNHNNSFCFVTNQHGSKESQRITQGTFVQNYLQIGQILFEKILKVFTMAFQGKRAPGGP